MELVFKKRQILVCGCDVIGKMKVVNKDNGEVVAEFRYQIQYSEQGYKLNVPNRESAIKLMNTSINQFKKNTIEAMG